MRLINGLSNALLQAAGNGIESLKRELPICSSDENLGLASNVRPPQMCPLFWTGRGEVSVGLQSRQLRAGAKASQMTTLSRFCLRS